VVAAREGIEAPRIRVSHTQNMLTGSAASMPLDTPSLFSASVWARFWAKVDVRGPDDCWDWHGAHDGGYGIISVNGRLTRAPRIVLADAIGRQLRTNEYACHKCDHPPCVNPSHLFVGSARDNSHDMLRKGRNVVGATTRLGRIRAAVQRGLARSVEFLAWTVARAEAGRFFDPIESIAVACDIEPTDCPPEPMPDTDEQLDRARALAILDEASKGLPFKWRAVLSLRRQGYTLEECGRRLRLTRERCRQIEELAIAKLQKHKLVVAFVHGAPPPPPVPASVVERITLRDRARVINEKCAAVFVVPLTDERKAALAKMRRRSRLRQITNVAKERPLSPAAKGLACGFCRKLDHAERDCMAKWRAERRANPAPSRPVSPRFCRLCKQPGHYAKTCALAQVTEAA
jgi:RNA polymerase sigma factor (sigma-70 family)